MNGDVRRPVIIISRKSHVRIIIIYRRCDIVLRETRIVLKLKRFKVHLNTPNGFDSSYIAAMLKFNLISKLRTCNIVDRSLFFRFIAAANYS